MALFSFLPSRVVQTEREAYTFARLVYPLFPPVYVRGLCLLDFLRGRVRCALPGRWLRVCCVDAAEPCAYRCFRRGMRCCIWAVRAQIRNQVQLFFFSPKGVPSDRAAYCCRPNSGNYRSVLESWFFTDFRRLYPYRGELGDSRAFARRSCFSLAFGLRSLGAWRDLLGARRAGNGLID